MTTRATDAVAIFYPETDGMPLPDGEFQAPLYSRINRDLMVYFQNHPGVRVNGNTFIYYIEGDPRRSVSPDCYVVFNLSDEAMESIERNNSYLVWEVGKAPDFILEIGSPSTASVDLGRKRDLYADLDVLEYWQYDATGGDFYGEGLVGERLVNGEYRRIEMVVESDGRVWGRSEVLGLDIWWDDGRLRFWDRESESWLLSQEEEQAGRLAAEARVEEEISERLAAESRADSAQTRAEQERSERLAAETRAEQERTQRLAAEARLAELESELRRLRGE